MSDHLRLNNLILFLAVSVTIFSCSDTNTSKLAERTAKGNVKLGGTLRVPLNTEISDFDPRALVGSDKVEVGIHLHEGLVRLDPETFEVIPGVARSWSWDTSNQTLFFELRKGAGFHGAVKYGNSSIEINAQDVLASFHAAAKQMDEERFVSLMGKRIKGAIEFRNGTSETISGLKAIDDYSLNIALLGSEKSFLYLLAQPEFAIVPYPKDPEAPVVGAGPFRLLGATGNLVMVRNPDYHLTDAFGNKVPYIDTLIFVPCGSNEERLEKLLAGEIDLVTGLELSPVRQILDEHISLFSGSNPELVMERESENASYDTYTIYRKGLIGRGSGFMGYLDHSRVQIEQ